MNACLWFSLEETWWPGTFSGRGTTAFQATTHTGKYTFYYQCVRFSTVRPLIFLNYYCLRGIFWFFLEMYVIQHCFIYRPSDSTVLEDAGIEPRTVATLALSATSSDHLARSHPLSKFLVALFPSFARSFCQWHFGTDKDPRIRASDQWFRLLFISIYVCGSGSESRRPKNKRIHTTSSSKDI